MAANEFTQVEETTETTPGAVEETQVSEGQGGDVASGESLDDELARLAVARSLGLKDFTEMKKYQDQIARLTDWAKSEGAEDLNGLVSRINALRSDVGMNKDIYSLSVYAGMALEKLHLDKEMASFKEKEANATPKADSENL